MLWPNLEQCSTVGSAGISSFTNYCTIVNAELPQSNAQKSTSLKLSTLENVVAFTL